MLNKKTVQDIEVCNKKVLVRCDFNVPLDKVTGTKITSDKRIVESLKTIKYLINEKAKVILCSHIGSIGENKSLKSVAIRLSQLLEQDVIFANDILSNNTKKIIDNMKNGDVVLLENTRMYKEEGENDLEFAKKLASLADIFVNDAFGSAHRAHASTEGVTHFLPSVAGFLIEKEIAVLDGAINNPQRPLLAIVGGAKVSSKIGVLNALLDKVDVLIIAGAMTYTFLKAKGINIGSSKCEDDKLDITNEIIKKAKDKNVALILPIDNIVAKEMSENATCMSVDINKIEPGYMGLDIGDKTIELFKQEIQKAKTIVWNGPVGVFEIEQFSHGTEKIAIALSTSKAITIIGGGDVVCAIEKFDLQDKMTHVSTGGGASLEFIEGRKLPGIESLQDK